MERSRRIFRDRHSNRTEGFSVNILSARRAEGKKNNSIGSVGLFERPYARRLDGRRYDNRRSGAGYLDSDNMGTRHSGSVVTLRSSGTIVFIRHIANILALSFALTTAVASFSHCKGRRISSPSTEDRTKNHVSQDKVDDKLSPDPEIADSNVPENQLNERDAANADHGISSDEEAGVPIVGGQGDEELIEGINLDATRNALIELEQRARSR